MVYLDLFTTFVLIGFVSFGGGYAIIPMIELEVTRQGWMTTQELTDVIAIAGMSPGPIATNSAVFIGFQVGGLLGAFVAALAITLPSIIIVVFISTFFYKINEKPLVQSSLAGIRPIITALIIYAAFSFGRSNGLFDFTLNALLNGLLFLLCLLLLWKYRLHPLVVILIAGIIGVMIF